MQSQLQNNSTSAQKPEAIDTKIEKSVLGAIPTFRRTMSLNDKVQSGDTFGALTIVGTAAILLPEDIRDAKTVSSKSPQKLKGKNMRHHMNTSFISIISHS